ncbi:MAG: hypothetical protein J6A80_08460 [Lachnospiraceae bacterium]|nr:hypothetical protein [Lachnospiraceae bacterium]MBO5326246.1 hypothetical protein [Lachnospiraceae bacterium]
MDNIKEKIEEIVEKIKKDPNFKEDFMKDPEKALEKATGIDIPDGMVDKVVDGVKAKLAGDKLSGAMDSIKKLF